MTVKATLVVYPTNISTLECLRLARLELLDLAKAVRYHRRRMMDERLTRAFRYVELALERMEKDSQTRESPPCGSGPSHK